jgi:hypothetical protein
MARPRKFPEGSRTVSARMEDWLAESAEKLAKQKDMTLSEFIRSLLDREVKDAGPDIFDPDAPINWRFSNENRFTPHIREDHQRDGFLYGYPDRNCPTCRVAFDYLRNEPPPEHLPPPIPADSEGRLFTDDQLEQHRPPKSDDLDERYSTAKWRKIPGESEEDRQLRLAKLHIKQYPDRTDTWAHKVVAEREG